jgi:hypothetical protein
MKALSKSALKELTPTGLGFGFFCLFFCFFVFDGLCLSEQERNKLSMLSLLLIGDINQKLDGKIHMNE